MFSNQYSYFGMHFLWWIVWIGLLLWIFAMPWDVPGQRKKKDTPLQIAKKRFAQGQLTLEEYLELKKNLKH